MLVDQIRLVATIGAKLIGVVSWVSLRYYRRLETERSGHNWTHRPLSTTRYTHKNTQNTQNTQDICTQNTQKDINIHTKHTQYTQNTANGTVRTVVM